MSAASTPPPLPPSIEDPPSASISTSTSTTTSTPNHPLTSQTPKQKQKQKQKQTPIQLLTPRLLLRAALASDAPALHALFRDPAVMRYWSTRPHASLAHTHAWLANMCEADMNGVGEFVMCRRAGGAEEVIGKIGIWRLDSSTDSAAASSGEIGFLMHRAHWRRGLMREAMQEALLPYLFAAEDEAEGGAGLGLEAVRADVDPRNAASLGLLAGLGFEVTGRESATLWIGAAEGGGGDDVGGGGVGGVGGVDDGEWVDSVYLRLGRERWLRREGERGRETKWRDGAV